MLMVPPHEIHVCKADDDDLKEVDQLLWETLWRPVGLPHDIRQRFRLPGPEVVLIARRHGQFVGAVVGQAVDSREMELRHLAIRPDSQRSGIGSALVRRLVEYCREHGYVSIRTHARNTSQAFFEKQGFVAVPGQTLTHSAFEKHGINFQVMRWTLKQQ